MKPETTALLGRTIGHIRLVDVLGEGGMGAVYVGFDDRLQRRIAVKAIRARSRLDPDAKARFLREARILSQLEHPHICTVHDYVQGEDTDFLVMELVQGTSLRQALREPLEPRRGMAVAEQLLDVLVVVHGQGVIHRDLKPENVMVTPDGGIKVLDFGLSRSADEEHQRSAAQTIGFGEGTSDRPGAARSTDGAYFETRLGTVLGTAGYMSPEQARGEAATSASDMYSVGLMLQEMFTGEAPFEQGLDAEELLRRAAEGETRPVEGLDPDLTALIERLKSLAPGARPSALDAAAMIRRIIDRPRRRRRRKVVATIWTALLLLAAGLAVQSVRALRGQQAARQEARRANQEAEAARQVADFAVGLFEIYDPSDVRGSQVTARELVDRGLESVREFEGQPIVQGRLMETMGRIYSHLGLYEKAESLLEQAVSRLREGTGVSRLDLARAFFDLGVLYDTQGRYEEARTSFEQSLTLREEQLGADDPLVAACVNSLAIVSYNLGDYARARPLLERSLRIKERTLGSDHTYVANTLLNLGLLHHAMGSPTEAERCFKRALEIQERGLAPDHPDLATTLTNLGALYQDQGRYAEAGEALQGALRIWERSLGPDHSDVGVALHNLANLYRDQGRFEEAGHLYRRSQEIFVRSLGTGHVYFATSLREQAGWYRDQGELAAAEPLYRRALEVFEKAVGPDHIQVAETLHEYARLLHWAGREEEAESLDERADGIRAAATGQAGTD